MEQDNLDNGIVVYCTKGNVMFNSSGELVENVSKSYEEIKHLELHIIRCIFRYDWNLQILNFGPKY